MKIEESSVMTNLIEAEKKALHLFQVIEDRGIIAPSRTEKQINADIYDLAFELYGIDTYWHKKIVRVGENTLRPYDDNPPDITVQEDDIVFLDFGPVFEEWEADFGRTYVLGNDPYKKKLSSDIEKAWYQTKQWVLSQSGLTGAELYQYVTAIAKEYEWTFGGEIAGHLIGAFPHEKLEPGNFSLYVHPDNHNDMFLPDANGKPRHWILEIHFVDRARKIGGFFEQVLL